MQEGRRSVNGFLGTIESRGTQDRARDLLSKHLNRLYAFEVKSLRRIAQLERRLTVAEGDVVELVWSREHPQEGSNGKCRATRIAEAAAQGGGGAGCGGGVTAVCHRAAVEEQKRRLREAPVYTGGVYTEAKLALIGSKRDKVAEADMLGRKQAAVSYRYWGGRKAVKLV